MQANFQSHRDVYDWLIANRDKSDEEILTKFARWSAADEWITMPNPEYLFAIHQLCDGIVDWPRFFREHEAPFEHLAIAPANEVSRIPRLSFYAMYDLTKIFTDGGNIANRDRVNTLVAMRNSASDYLLIDPHAESEDNFVRIEHDYETWKMPVGDNIRRPKFVVDSPPVGKPTIVDLETAQRRFRRFTCEIFDACAKTSGLEFPWDKVVFAGGSATKLISAEYAEATTRGSDLDIFIVGQTFADRKKTVDTVLLWFAAKGCAFYALTGSVCTVYLRGVKRTFQVISDNSTSVWQILSRFDTTHIQWACRGSPYGGNQMQWLATPQACRAMNTRVTVISNGRRLKSVRLVKALACGYEIEVNTAYGQELAIETVLNPATPQTLNTLLTQIGGYYYPAEDDDDDYALSMIESLAKPTFSSMDVNFAIANIFIGGSFEDNYESLLFKTFSPTNLITDVRRGNRTFMRTRHGEARIMTDLMRVKLVTNANDMEIQTVVTDEFAAFVRVLETAAWAVYAGSRRGVTVAAVNKDVVTWTIPSYSIERMLATGRSCLRNHRGNNLNIVEDLASDDQVQIMFKVEVVIGTEDRYIKLHPHRIIKYGDDDAATGDFDAAVDEALRADVPDSKAEIDYVV